MTEEELPPAPLDGAASTEQDEEAVLTDLYGGADGHGVYLGVGA